MKINVKHIGGDHPNGQLKFQSQGILCSLLLPQIEYVEINLKENLITIPNLHKWYDLDNMYDTLKTDEICINIDGWFHIFYELIFEYINYDIMRVYCKHRNEG